MFKNRKNTTRYHTFVDTTHWTSGENPAFTADGAEIHRRQSFTTFWPERKTVDRPFSRVRTPENASTVVAIGHYRDIIVHLSSFRASCFLFFFFRAINRLFWTWFLFFDQIILIILFLVVLPIFRFRFYQPVRKTFFIHIAGPYFISTSCKR